MTTYRHYGLAVTHEGRAQLGLIVGKSDRITFIDLDRDQLWRLAQAALAALCDTEDRPAAYWSTATPATAHDERTS